jgi:hypothetical protein
MKFGQSGVSGILGFLDTLSRGQQESQARRSKTLDMSLGFAKENRELERQNKLDQRNKDAFDAQQRLSGINEETARLGLEKTKKGDYGNAFQMRQSVINAELADKAKLPELTRGFALAKTPADKASFQAQIAAIQSNRTKRRREFELGLDGLTLSPEERTRLINFDDNASPAGSPYSSLIGEAGGPTTFGQQQQPFGIGQGLPSGTQPLPQQPSEGSGLSPELMAMLNAGGVTIPNQSAEQLPPTGLPTQGSPTSGPVTTGSLFPNNAQAGPMASPPQTGLPQDIISFLAEMGVPNPVATANKMTPADYATLVKTLQDRNYSKSITPGDIPDIERDEKGNIKPETLPTQVAYGKMIPRIMPDIRRTLRSMASREDISLDVIQKELFGEDQANWIIDSEGKDQKPANMEPVISAMSQYVAADPKDILAINSQQITSNEARLGRIDKEIERGDKIFSDAMERATRIRVAEIGARGAVDAATKQIRGGEIAAAQEQVQTAVTGIKLQYDEIMAASRLNDPNQFTQLGIYPQTTKQGFPASIGTTVAGIIANKLASALSMEYSPTLAVKNPQAVVRQFRVKTLLAKLAGFRYGADQSRSAEVEAGQDLADADAPATKFYTTMKEQVVEELKSYGLDENGKPLKQK